MNICLNYLMITHKTNLFCLYQENKPYASKGALDMLVIIGKSFLKLSNFLMLIKQNSVSFLCSCNYQVGQEGFYQPWFVKGVYSRMHSIDGSKEVWAWTIHTSSILQYVPEGILFSRFLEGLICGSYILDCWGRGQWLRWIA